MMMIAMTMLQLGPEVIDSRRLRMFLFFFSVFSLAVLRVYFRSYGGYCNNSCGGSHGAVDAFFDKQN